MSRKKPITSGNLGSGASQHSYDLNSRGIITSRETLRIRPKLVSKLGHRRAEEVMGLLESDMDRDGGWGSKSVSSKEIDQIMKTLEEGRYNGMDSHDLENTRKILEEYQ